MKVKIHDTAIKHDLTTGEQIDERALEPYTIEYRSMNPEEN